MSKQNQGKRLPHVLVTRIERMTREGRSLRGIAREVGVSYNTVAKYSPRDTTPDRRSGCA